MFDFGVHVLQTHEAGLVRYSELHGAARVLGVATSRTSCSRSRTFRDWRWDAAACREVSFALSCSFKFDSTNKSWPASSPATTALRNCAGCTLSSATSAWWNWPGLLRDRCSSTSGLPLKRRWSCTFTTGTLFKLLWSKRLPPWRTFNGASSCATIGTKTPTTATCASQRRVSLTGTNTWVVLRVWYSRRSPIDAILRSQGHCTWIWVAVPPVRDLVVCLPAISLFLV